MNEYGVKRVAIFAVCIAVTFLGCNHSSITTSSFSDNSSSCQSSSASSSSLPEVFSPNQELETPYISSSDTFSSSSCSQNDSLPEPDSHSESNAKKLEFVSLEDERIQFSSTKEVVGTEDELQKCKKAFEKTRSELGKLVVSGDNQVEFVDQSVEHFNQLTDDILDLYRRTTLRTISQITAQDPRATTRGVSIAAFYDQEGHRVWLAKCLGDLFWIELEDSQNILVFGGCLGM